MVSNSTASTSVNPDPPETREATLLVLSLLYTLGLAALTSIKMELDLLASAPAHISELSINDDRSASHASEDSTWRLDRQPGQYKPRELISGGGKVLRPFTILPSTSAMSDRERLRSEVFRNGHRLPTMTIDEYLEEERRMGNIITGGG